MTDSLTASTPAAVADALPAPAGGGLPAPLTSFVGREREVAALRRLLGRHSTRLVVLTGPGGVGKTRLALRAAAEAAPRFPDGVVFVPLAAVRSPMLLAPTVAEALGLVDDGRPVDARLVERLRPCRVLLLAGGLGWYWSSADHFREARDLFAAVVAMPGGEAAPAALVNALTSAGDIANWMDDQDGATGFYERALALRRALGDDAAAILLVRCLGNVAIDRGDLDRAESLLTESLGLARAAGEAWEEAAAVNLLGLVAGARGDFAAALPRHAEAAAGWARLGDHGHETTALASLAWAALAADDLETAGRTFGAVLDRSLPAPDELNVLSALTGAATIAARRGDARRAAALFAAAAAERERLGIDPRRPWIRERCDRALAAARGSLGEADFAAATAEGRSRPLADALAAAAVVLAAGDGGRGSAAVLADPYTLTRRERDVLRVLARGASDKEIAAALFIERPTASKHVAAVLAKLGVSSRAAAALAARAGLA